MRGLALLRLLQIVHTRGFSKVFFKIKYHVRRIPGGKRLVIGIRPNSECGCILL